MRYDRAAYVRCRLHVIAGPDSGYGEYAGEGTEFRHALAGYFAGLERALERRFGQTLDLARAAPTANRALLMLFRSTAASHLALRTPWSGYLEAGLLVKRLEAAGPAGEQVLAASGRIEEAVASARRDHLHMLDTLAAIVLADRADAAFTSEDLRADGFDDTRRPLRDAYPEAEF